MLKDATDEHAAKQLARKTWAELEVLEHAGYLLFPEKIFRRTKSGEFVGEDVRVRVLREPDKRKARMLARQWADEERVDPKLDPDLFDDMDTCCQLWLALRSPTAPHEPLALDPKELESRYDRGSLEQLWAKLDAYTQLVDPRGSSMTSETVVALAAAISKERSIVPLHAFDGRSQVAFILTMADLLTSSLESKSSSERSEPSTPET